MQDSVPHSARSPLPGPNSLLLTSLIKIERQSPSELGCFSSSLPFTNSFPSFNHIPSFTSGRTATTNTRRKRSALPYTRPPPRVNSGRRQPSSTMSAPHYGNWPSDAVKYEKPEYPSGDLSHMRGSNDGDKQPPYYFASVSCFTCIRCSAEY